MLAYAGIGSRTITPHEESKAATVANILRRVGMTLYSGGAEGADTAFHSGAGEASVIWVPWRNAGNIVFPVGEVIVGGDDPIGIKYTEKYHPNPGALSRGGRALMARNALQILGQPPNHPEVKFVVCIADKAEGDFVKGGTGQAVRIALDRGLPVYNLRYLEVMEALDKIKELLGFDMKRTTFKHPKSEIHADFRRTSGDSICETCGRPVRYHNVHQYGDDYDVPLFLFRTCDGRFWKL